MANHQHGRVENRLTYIRTEKKGKSMGEKAIFFALKLKLKEKNYADKLSG